MSLEFILSSKGRPKAIYKGFLYTRDEERRENTVWRCQNRTCGVRLKACGNQVIREPKEHRFHAPSSAEVAKARISDYVSRANECSSTRNTVLSAMASIPVTIAAEVQSKAALSQQVRRKRRRDMLQDDDEIIPRHLQLTISGEQFYFPCGDNLLFTSNRCLKILSDHKHWLADGTFYVAPRDFLQLYTIHALLENSVTVPCAFALLKSKSTATYTELLDVFGSTGVLSPNSIIVDFEAAAISAFKTKYPQASLHACFFHLSQSVWRHLQTAGLQTRYYEDANFSLLTRCLPALAFVPTDVVDEAFATLTTSEEFPRELDPIVDYFESTYIGTIGRTGRRRRPMYEVSLWSQYESVKAGLPRTTNSLEGWHSAFNKTVGIAHPNVKALVKRLQLEEASVCSVTERIQTGHKLPQQKKKYRELTERIARVVNNYDNVPIMTYLKSIGHNIQL